MLCDDLHAVLGFEIFVEDVVDHERGAGGAGAQAARADDRRPDPAWPVRANSASMAAFTRFAPEAMQPAPVHIRTCLWPEAVHCGLLGPNRVPKFG